MFIEEACLEAGYTRLGSIWKSTITRLGGSVPTAYGWGQALRATNGAGHGLGASPCLARCSWFTGYLFVEDAKRGFAKMLRRSSAKYHQPNDGQAADGL